MNTKMIVAKAIVAKAIVTSTMLISMMYDVRIIKKNNDDNISCES